MDIALKVVDLMEDLFKAGDNLKLIHGGQTKPHDPSSSKTVQMKKKNPPRRCLTADGLLRCGHDAVGAIAAPVIGLGSSPAQGVFVFVGR
jgi:hypothetical protein